MERKPGRDFGLTVRMALAGSVLAGLYVVAFAVPVLLAAAGALEAHWALVLLGCGAFLVYGHWASGDSLALRVVGARRLPRTDAPELHAAVERLAALADVPPPRLALVESDVPNAFAAGRSPQHSTVAVTDGLLRRLEPAEVEAVLAHELAHVANRDGAVMTLAGFPALTLRSTLASAPLRVWIFGFPLMVLAGGLYGLALAMMLLVSRCREYSADRGAALITGAPEQLMSALQKIAGSMDGIPAADLRAVATMSAFFIVPTSPGSYAHPPLDQRLARLAELARDLGRVDLPASVERGASSRRRLLELAAAFAIAFPLFVLVALVLLR